MKLYRVTFTTSLLVESEDPERAIKIAEECLVDEVRNRSSRLLLDPKGGELLSPAGLVCLSPWCMVSVEEP